MNNIPERDAAVREPPGNRMVGPVLVLLGCAFVLTGIAILRPTPAGQRIAAAFGPAEDGSWAGVSIDGRVVRWDDYRVGITGRQVDGGRDGCNDWGYGEPDASGARTISSTLQACPEDDPLRKAYWALISGGGVTLRGEDLLELRGRGHVALFRRCEWRILDESTRYTTSIRTACVPRVRS